MEPYLSPRAVSSLFIASLHFVAAILTTWLLRKWRSLPLQEWLIVLWLVYDAIVHFTLVRWLSPTLLHSHYIVVSIQEGPFVLFSLNSTVLESSGILAEVCKGLFVLAKSD